MAKELTLLGSTVTLDLTVKADAPADSDRLALAAKVLEVKDDGAYATAAEIIQTCAARIKAHEDIWAPARQTSHLAHKTITETITKLTRPYTVIRSILETKMKDYRNAQEAAKVARETEIRDSGNALQKELADKARELRRAGDIRGAKELEAQAGTVITDIVLPDAKPEVQGLTEKRPWQPVIEKPMALIVAVAEGRVPLLHTIPKRGGGEEEFPILEINMAVLKHYVQTLGPDIAQKLPGIKAEKGLTFSVKARD